MELFCDCNETRLREYEDLLRHLEDKTKSTERQKIVKYDFGKVSVGETKIGNLKINFDKEKTSMYIISKIDTTYPSYQVFYASQYNGMLKMQKTCKISIIYKPLIPYVSDVGNFQYSDEDGIFVKIMVRGEAIGPLLRFSARQLIFYKTPIKRQLIQVVEVSNDSEAMAEFMFVCNTDPDLFQVKPSSGKICGGTHIYVRIKFTPKSCGYFSQLLPCLVLYHAPYVIHLFGWNINEIIDPNQLQLEYYQRPFTEKFGYAAYLMDSTFLRAVDTPFSISKIFIDFGRSIPGITLESTGFNATITNFTDNDIELRWMEDNDIFDIIPHEVVVKPNTSSPFALSFTPKETHKFYFRSLLGQIYWPRYDFSRSVLNVPLTVNVLLLGHSFPKNQYWIPMFKMSENIVFAPCLPGDIVYTNFKIENTGQLPIIFKIIAPKESNIIVKPMIGFIRKFVIISAQLKTDKNVPKNYFETWLLVLNGCEGRVYNFTFRGITRHPTLLFGKDDIIFMETAQAGTETSTKTVVKNSSCFKIRFKLVFDYPAYLRVEPDETTVEAHDQIAITLYFQSSLDAPKKITGTCKMRALSQSDVTIGEEFTHNFVVYCNSSLSQLCCAPNGHDFGPVKWNSQIETSFTMFNFGDCTVYFKIDPIKGTNSFRFDPVQGEVRATKKIKITLKGVANLLAENEFVVSYSNRKGPESNEIVKDSSMEIFRFSYSVSLFTLQIRQIAANSFGHLFSNHTLWDYLNINSINDAMQEICPGDTKTIDMRMPEFVEGDREYSISLCLKNPTNLEGEITLKRKRICSCPMKQDKTSFNTSKLIYDCPHRELLTLELSDSKFSDSSRHHLFVRVKYTLPGINTVAYILSIGDDRTIEIRCTIPCIPENVEKISCYRKHLKMEFRNMFIGMWYGPIQTYWLYNNTKLTSTYSVNTSVIQDLCHIDGFKVLEILNPEGEIEPGYNEPLMIRFHPIETKRYEVNLPIRLADEELILTVTGLGLPKKDIKHIICDKKIATSGYVSQKNAITLSTECLVFDQLCCWNKINKILFIKNNSNSVLQYEWIDSSIKYFLEATASPKFGLLLPKESHTIMVTISSYNEPIITEINMPCMIYNINEIYMHTKSLKEYEEEEKRLEGYFTITEKGTIYPKNKKVVLPKSEPKCITLTLHIKVIHSKDADDLWTTVDQFSVAPRDVIDIDISNITEANAAKKQTISFVPANNLDFQIINTATSLITELISYFVFSRKFEYLIKSSTQLIPPYYYQFTTDITEILENKKHSKSLSLMDIKEQRKKDVENLFDRPTLPILADTIVNLLFDTIHQQFHLGPPYPREMTKEEIDHQIEELLRSCEQRKCVCDK